MTGQRGGHQPAWVRYAAQDASARCIAEWATQQPQVRRVLHPAVAGSPGHEHWKRTCRSAAGLLSLEMDPKFDVPSVDAFVDRLTRFRIGWSWGGPVSLAVPYRTRLMRKLASPIEGTVVRLCSGLESPQDLIEDLSRSMAQLV